MLHERLNAALGRSTKGYPLAQLDVDPRHGGEVDGALVASLVGDRAAAMVASTPGGAWRPRAGLSRSKRILRLMSICACVSAGARA
jgi:hypothetical protein